MLFGILDNQTLGAGGLIEQVIQMPLSGRFIALGDQRAEVRTFTQKLQIFFADGFQLRARIAAELA